MATQPRPDLPTHPVGRRLVCYLSGFDPQGPAHYHQLYRSEGTKQADVSGYELKVGPRSKQGAHFAVWEVEALMAGQTVSTRYEFLRWDDIVRQHWPRGRIGLLSTTVWASWQMWRNGVMWRSLKTSWPMFLAIALPGIAVLGFASLGLSALALVGFYARQGQFWAAGAVVALGLPLGWLAAVRVEARTHMAWLMRSLACLVRQGRGQMPELEERLDLFAEHLANQARAAEFDEILVVGHSSGAMMAMSVMARAVRLLATQAPGLAAPQLSLLTLGHCAPLLSAQPEAVLFRSELQTLVDSPDLCWMDYGAPPDGCCFPLVDPSAARGVAGEQGHRPKLLNPRFAQLFGAKAYRTLKADKFSCHFQYLRAADLHQASPPAYDYFAITAGPTDLSSRHAEAVSQTGFRQFQVLGGPEL